jgi:hypothetical protein
MYGMAELRSDLKRRCCVLAFSLPLSLTLACARPDVTSPVSTQKLPFHSDDQHAAESDAGRPLVPPDPKSDGGMPFHAGTQTRLLPSGTLLTVQLNGSLSAAKVHAGDTFTASVAAPLAIDGETMVDRGSLVTGRIESEQSDAGAPALGYFRLILNGITVGAITVPLQTSSLFARGTLQPSSVSSRSGSIRVQKGRRLTFRLTAPVSLPASSEDQNASANRQHSSLGTE